MVTIGGRRQSYNLKFAPKPARSVPHRYGSHDLISRLLLYLNFKRFPVETMHSCRCGITVLYGTRRKRQVTCNPVNRFGRVCTTLRDLGLNDSDDEAFRDKPGGTRLCTKPHQTLRLTNSRRKCSANYSDSPALDRHFTKRQCHSWTSGTIS